MTAKTEAQLIRVIELLEDIAGRHDTRLSLLEAEVLRQKERVRKLEGAEILLDKREQRW